MSKTNWKEDKFLTFLGVFEFVGICGAWHSILYSWPSIFPVEGPLGRSNFGIHVDSHDSTTMRTRKQRVNAFFRHPACEANSVGDHSGAIVQRSTATVPLPSHRDEEGQIESASKALLEAHASLTEPQPEVKRRANA